jgi:hypothetical protein
VQANDLSAATRQECEVLCVSLCVSWLDWLAVLAKKGGNANEAKNGNASSVLGYLGGGICGGTLRSVRKKRPRGR